MFVSTFFYREVCFIRKLFQGSSCCWSLVPVKFLLWAWSYLCNLLYYIHTDSHKHAYFAGLSWNQNPWCHCFYVFPSLLGKILLCYYPRLVIIHGPHICRDILPRELRFLQFSSIMYRDLCAGSRHSHSYWQNSMSISLKVNSIWERLISVSPFFPLPQVK